MKILMTGMSARSVGSTRTRHDYLALPDMLHGALVRAGHEVDRRVVAPGEDLGRYDRALVLVNWVSSLSSMHVHEAALVLAQMGGDAATYCDDWRVESMGDDVWRHTQSDVGWGQHVKFREREYGRLTLTERGAAREALGALVLPGSPHRMLAPLYDWGDHSLLFAPSAHPVLPKELIAWDPSGLIPPTTGREPSHGVRPREWVMATLQNHDRWLESLHAAWPVVQYGGVKKTAGGANAAKGTVVPESVVIDAYATHRGMLVPPYKSAGSGWWRPRYTFALRAGAIVHCDPADGQRIGPSFTNALADVESATDHDLDSLQRRQRGQFDLWGWDRRRVMMALEDALR